MTCTVSVPFTERSARIFANAAVDRVDQFGFYDNRLDGLVAGPSNKSPARDRFTLRNLEEMITVVIGQPSPLSDSHSRIDHFLSLTNF